MLIVSSTREGFNTLTSTYTQSEVIRIHVCNLQVRIVRVVGRSNYFHKDCNLPESKTKKTVLHSVFTILVVVKNKETAFINKRIYYNSKPQ